MKGEALKGHLDLLILATVAAGPLHGYAVVEELKNRSGGRFDLPEGTVYPALHRLEESGLLSSAWSTVAGRRRRVYELSHRGHRALVAQEEAWRHFSAAVTDVVAGATCPNPA